jgi:hypothetical protein
LTKKEKEEKEREEEKRRKELGIEESKSTDMHENIKKVDEEAVELIK